MSSAIATSPRFKFFDDNGSPAASHLLYTYLAGTMTDANTWQDQAQSTLNTNPIVLDANGECVLWLTYAQEYKLILKTPLGATLSTTDDVSGANYNISGPNSSITSMTGLTAPTAAANPVRSTDAQVQLVTAFSTSGTSGTLAVVTSPLYGSLVNNQRMRLKFNAASTGTDTLNRDGTGAILLKQYDSTGAKVPAVFTSNQLSDVEYDGAHYVILDALPPVSSAQIQSISASVAASALTISASSISLSFRSTTLGSGTVTTISGTPDNLVVPSTATLGTINAVQSRIVVLAINNAGTIELAVVNQIGGNDLSETGVINTTAIAAGSNTANVIYSTSARTGVSYRVIGYIESTQATAGTWATAPSTIQGQGGQALAAMSSLGYGQTWQVVTRTSGTTYYNTTGRPLMLVQRNNGSTTSTLSTISINGAAAFSFVYNSVPSGFAGAAGSVIIPVGASYLITNTGATSVVTTELS